MMSKLAEKPMRSQAINASVLRPAFRMLDVNLEQLREAERNLDMARTRAEEQTALKIMAYIAAELAGTAEYAAHAIKAERVEGANE